MRASIRIVLTTVWLAAATAPPATSQEQPSAPAATDGRTVTVFAAASLKTVLDEIMADWKKTDAGQATASYAASSLLAKQIEAGAPADIFASADLKWMDYVAEKNLIDVPSRVALLGNSLVLVSPAGSTLTIKIAKGFGLAAALGDGRLATGETQSVPAGIYAKAALQYLGVWDEVSPKIVAADNVRSALAFVARREVPLGIVYRTDAGSDASVRIVDTFPSDSHPPIVYPFALTNAGASKAAAKELLAYVRSSAAAAVFRKHGFVVLEQ